MGSGIGSLKSSTVTSLYALDQMSVRLHGKFGSFLRNKTKSLEWLQTFCSVDSITYSHWREGWLWLQLEREKEKENYVGGWTLPPLNEEGRHIDPKYCLRGFGVQVSTVRHTPSETGKQGVHVEKPTQTSTQQEQWQKTRHTHPLKHVPSMQPGPISLPTRPRGRASTEESISN